jgi:hypothetical protein
MVRAYLPAVVVFCAGFAAAAAPPSRPLVPTGGMWQSVPYTADAGERAEPPKTAAKAEPNAKPRPEKKAAAAPKPQHPPRHPVAAAAPSENAPPTTAAARTRELERRIDALSPGARLGEPLADPENPSWRRARPGRPAGEHNSLSVPFDEKGQAGFIARGYHAQPDVQNPNGNTGATFGLRTRF